MESPRRSAALRMNSSVHRVIDRTNMLGHPKDVYAEELSRAEGLLAAVGKSAMQLSGASIVRSGNGGERILFTPSIPDQLETYGHALDGIPTDEVVNWSAMPKYLYMQFASKSLVQDIGRRRELLEEFDERVHSETGAQYMYADDPKIVMRDVQYPLHFRQSRRGDQRTRPDDK